MNIKPQSPESYNPEEISDKAPSAFLLENSFFSHPKTLRLIDKHGAAGALEVLHIWSWLTTSSTGYLEIESALVLGRAAGIGCDEMAQIIESAVGLGLLERTENGKEVFSSRILSSRERFFAKRENYVKARARREGVKRESSVSSPRIQGESSTAPIINTNTILSKPITDGSLTGGGVGEPKPPAPPPEPIPPPQPAPDPAQNPLEAAAERYLEPIASEKVQKSKAFVSSGRRPCRMFPNVWLTSPEFISMLEIYEKSGVKRTDLKDLLRACEAKMLELRAAGKDPQMKSAFSWLTGFLLEDYLKKRKATNDVQRSEAYLQAAEAVRV